MSLTSHEEEGTAEVEDNKAHAVSKGTEGRIICRAAFFWDEPGPTAAAAGVGSAGDAGDAGVRAHFMLSEKHLMMLQPFLSFLHFFLHRHRALCNQV